MDEYAPDLAGVLEFFFPTIAQDPSLSLNLNVNGTLELPPAVAALDPDTYLLEADTVAIIADLGGGDERTLVETSGTFPVAINEDVCIDFDSAGASYLARIGIGPALVEKPLSGPAFGTVSIENTVQVDVAVMDAPPCSDPIANAVVFVEEFEAVFANQHRRMPVLQPGASGNVPFDGFTDGSGLATVLVPFAPSTFTLKATKFINGAAVDGSSSSIAADPTSNPTPRSATITLPRTSIVRGRVFSDQNGRPVPNATVQDTTNGLSTTTAADGSFELSGCVGSLNTTLHAEKTVTGELFETSPDVSVTYIRGGTITQDLTLTTPGTFTATTSDQSDLDGIDDYTELVNFETDPSTPDVPVPTPSSLVVTPRGDASGTHDLDVTWNVPLGAGPFTMSIPSASQTHLTLIDSTGNPIASNQVTITRTNNTMTLRGASPGIAFVRVQNGTVDFEQPVVVRALAYRVQDQCAYRNCASSNCGGIADRNDGFHVLVSCGLFMWKQSILPTTRGRHGLAHDWTLYYNSRAYSHGGNFGTTPFDLACFQRLRKTSGGDFIFQEKEVREFRFSSSTGEAERELYHLLSTSGSDIQIRTPSGTKYTFFGFNGKFTDGALKRIENRFGDTLQFSYDVFGFLTEAQDVYGRSWFFTYDDRNRLRKISEGSGLKGRVVEFAYDVYDRLIRIDTTPVLQDGGIGNTFPNGKPYALRYPSPSAGLDLSLDTNISSIIYPNQMLDRTFRPRITNTYASTTNDTDHDFGSRKVRSVKGRQF